MLTPGAVAVLRRTGTWDLVRDLHRVVAPPACRVVHRAVMSADPCRLPNDLVLKHRFDQRLVWIDPRWVVGMVRTGEWARRDRGWDQRPIARLLRWWIRGGGNKTVLRHPSRNLHGSFVVGGDWDRPLRPFEPLASITSLLAGDPPRSTDEYQRMARWIEARDLRWTRGCRTMADLDRYFAELQRCMDAIEAQGYRTQRELGLDGTDEVRVCVDRDGQLAVFGGGTHRLSIALALEVERVPVTVKRVHTAWVADRRQRFAPIDTLGAVSLGIAAIERHGPSANPPASAPLLESVDGHQRGLR